MYNLLIDCYTVYHVFSFSHHLNPSHFVDSILPHRLGKIRNIQLQYFEKQMFSNTTGMDDCSSCGLCRWLDVATERMPLLQSVELTLQFSYQDHMGPSLVTQKHWITRLLLLQQITKAKITFKIIRVAHFPSRCTCIDQTVIFKTQLGQKLREAKEQNDQALNTSICKKD